MTRFYNFILPFGTGSGFEAPEAGVLGVGATESNISYPKI